MLSLTPAFDEMLRAALAARGADFGEPRHLSSQVLHLSDFYLENPGHPTPWEKDFAAPAYLAYFLPLNFIRLRAAFREVRRFLPAESIGEIWDFGSGSGATHWVLESESDFAPRNFWAIEKSAAARELHRELLALTVPRWQVQFAPPTAPAPRSLAVFSYSFLEMQQNLPKLERFSHLLLVEPSTRECGRDLMQWRQRFMDMGFQPLAPCTHSAACPLLTQSKKDWCHSRVHFSPPDWLARLEEFLPMKNRTLTFSYLLMSREVQDREWRGTARAIGDTLEENGKTRQMICRGPQREFLSWLHRLGPPPRIPHGSLIRGVESCEVKGAELRPPPGALKWTS